MTHDDRPEPPDPDQVDDRHDALARTRADLAAHAGATPPMPVGLLADIDRALTAERATERAATAPQAPPTPPARRPPRSRWLPGAVAAMPAMAAVAAALLVVALVVGVLVTSSDPEVPPGPIVAGPPVLTVGDGAGGLREGFGRADYGPLGDPARLAGCLAANGVPAGVRPVGARQVVVDDAPGVLLVLPTGVAGRFQVLVVGPGCAAGAPLTVSDMVVGR